MKEWSGHMLDERMATCNMKEWSGHMYVGHVSGLEKVVEENFLEVPSIQ